MATLEYLNAAESQNTSSQDGTKKIDYAAMIIHHKDNYHKLKQEKSILEEISGKVKVIDDVEPDNQTIENSTTGQWSGIEPIHNERGIFPWKTDIIKFLNILS